MIDLEEYKLLSKLICVKSVEGIGQIVNILSYHDRENGNHKDIVFTYSHN